jgi:hypothetical protein
MVLMVDKRAKKNAEKSTHSSRRVANGCLKNVRMCDIVYRVPVIPETNNKDRRTVSRRTS